MKKYRKYLISKYYYMGFNLGDYLNNNVFDKLKPVTGFIGSIANTGLNLFQSLTSNFMNISKGVGNLLN